MPNQIISIQEQHQWDVIMLKCHASKFSYGIPGEYQCFQCSEQFESILDRYIHEFHTHSENSFGCRVCKLYFSDNGTLLKHFKREHSIFPKRSVQYLVCDPDVGKETSNLKFYY